MHPQKRNRPNSDFHKRITLKRMEHRGAWRIGLFFDYDAKLLANQIKRYLRQPYPPKRFLFEGRRRGHQYSYRSAQQIMKRAVKASGVNPRATLHSLRHSYATHLHQNGTDSLYSGHLRPYECQDDDDIHARVGQ